MKIYRRINNNRESMLELEVDIRYFRDNIEADSILDISDPAFMDFEEDVLSACELHDFQLEDSYQSNDATSMSLYYIYVKLTPEGNKLKVFLKIRVSDHVPSARYVDGKLVSYDRRDKAYTDDQARQYAKEHFNQPRGYRARRINIVFNDDNYQSYEAALQAIEERLDEFDPE